MNCLEHTCCDNVAVSFHLRRGLAGSLFAFVFMAELRIIGLGPAKPWFSRGSLALT